MRFLILVIFFLTGSYFSYAQWSHINSSWNSDDFYFVTINEGAGVSLAGGSQIIKSTDNGNTWSVVNTSTNEYHSGLILSNSTFIVVGETSGGTGKIWKSTNGGSSWTSVSSTGATINDIASNGTTLVAVGNSGTIRTSSDEGTTWVTIPSGVSTQLNTVEWNPLQSKWIIGGEQHRLVSTISNASTWTNASNTYKITDINFRNSYLVETRIYTAPTPDSSAVVVYDNAGNINNMTRCGFQAVTKSVHTPDNRILGTGFKKFFEVDLTLNELSIGVDSLYNQAIYSGAARNIKDIDICSSYALAVGINGGLSRYNLSNPLGTYAPADFIIPDTVLTCPGSAFVAIPICSQADTYQWYANNVLISTADTLFGNWPNTNTSYNIKLVTTTNGIQSVFTDYIYVTDGIIFPNYTITIDTTLCYGDNLSANFNLQSGSFSGFYSQFVSNNIVVGSSPAPVQSNMILYNMTNSTNIEIQLFKTGVCGTSYQSHDYSIHVGPDLNTHTLISADTGICSFGDSLHFSISNLIQGATYILTNNEFYQGSYIGPNPVDTIIGMGSDTLHLSYPGDQFYWSQLNSENIYAETDVFTYINAYATYDGCSTITSSFLSFDITNPNANFSIINQPSIVSDTLNIVNLQVTDSSMWSISPINGISSALNDSIPLFAPNQPAEYLVKLLNTTRFGCTDSLERKHVVGALLNNNMLSTTCYAKKLPSMCVLGSVLDNENNLIEYGYFAEPLGQWTSFAVRKLSPTGNLLWEKRPEYLTNFQGGAHYATAIEVDQYNNIYVALRLDGTFNTGGHPFDFENIHLQNNYNASYIVKWSPTGQIIATHPMVYITISDLELGNNQLHAVGNEAIMTFDLNLNLQHDYPLFGYTYVDNLTSSGVYWNWKPKYPRIVSLSNGKNIFITEIMIQSPSVTVSPGVIIVPNAIYSQVIFGAEYNPSQGLSNSRKLFEIAYDQYTSDRTPLIADLVADEESNIYLLTDVKEKRNMTYLDSVVTVESDQFNKCFIAKLDSDLNSEWIIHSNFFNASMDYAIGKGKLYITGSLKDKMYLGSINNFQIINGKNDDSYYNDEPFYGVISKQGSLLAGGALGRIGVFNRNKLSCSVSKCGELFISHQSRASDWSELPYGSADTSIHLEINGVDYHADSNYVFKLGETSCFGECPYLILSSTQDLTACNTDTVITIPVYETHNMDSTLYEIIENNVVVESGYAPIVNQSIEVPSIPSANQQLVLHGTMGSILMDTLQVQLIAAMNPMLPFYYVECSENLIVPLDPSNFPSVYWWNNNSGGSFDPTIIYTPSDFIIGDTVTYSIIYTDVNGCSSEDFFEILYCDNLGINENEQAKFIVYPNPASETINIQSLSEGYVGIMLDVIDTKGIKISTHSLDGMNTKISIQNLVNGYYFLRINSGNEQIELIPFIKE
jgi:hypothetical protein